MTEEWRDNLNELAKRKPIDEAHSFEFKSKLEYSPARTDEERTDSNTTSNSQPQPLVVNLLPAAFSPSRLSPPVPLAVYSSPVAQAPSSSSTSPPTRRRISFRLPPTVMRLEPQSPVSTSVEATKCPLLDQRFDKAHGYGKRERGDRWPKVYPVSLKPETAENIRCLHVSNFADAIFIYMEAHEDTRDFTAMQITSEAVLKIKYKAHQLEGPAVMEYRDIPSLNHAEKTVHTALLLLPCGTVVKNKRDSKEELLPLKSRLATGCCLMTSPKTYQPFDKTSLTASMYSAYSAPGIMWHNRMNLEVCDVPSAYLSSPLLKGKKHVLRVKPFIAIQYSVITDPTVKQYPQQPKNGPITAARLEKSLSCACDPGNDITIVWARIIIKNREDDQFVTAVSITVHSPSCYFRLMRRDSNRHKLDKASSNGEYLPRSIIVVNISVKQASCLPDLGFLNSYNPAPDHSCLSSTIMPRHYQSLPWSPFMVTSHHGCRTSRCYPTSIRISRRQATVDQSPHFDTNGIIISDRKETILFIAWSVNNIAAVVAYKHTSCAAPRSINDVDTSVNVTEFLANHLARMIMAIDYGIVFQSYPHVNVKYIIHEDNKKSHTGVIVTMGKLGEQGGVLPLAWRSLINQRLVSLSSTSSAKLIAVFDIMSGPLRCALGISLIIRRARHDQLTTLLVLYQDEDNTNAVTVSHMDLSSSSPCSSKARVNCRDSSSLLPLTQETPRCKRRKASISSVRWSPWQASLIRMGKSSSIIIMSSLNQVIGYGYHLIGNISSAHMFI